MKLTAVLLFIACLHATARTDAQTVTLSVKDAPLKQVFKEIQKQTGMNILAEEAVLESANKVTFTVKNMPVNDVLALCFKDEPLSFTITGGAIIVKEKTVEQKNILEQFFPPPPIDVHGRVVNEKGEVVPGVTVTVKGTKNATSTDANGYFEIKDIDEKATLVFTSTNMESFQIKVDGKTDLTINLKTKVTALGDVTIEGSTGYQTIKPNEVTGSLVVIDNKTLNQQVGSNILQRLDGVTSGLLFNIGKSSNNQANTTGISIRGLSTINGPVDPLIVVDGFIYQGNINNINPNDVENITVLKDASAASIWGARAGNGVIVITTKKGKFNQPFKIEFNTDVIVSNRPDLSNIHQMASSDYIDVEQFLFNKGYFNSTIANSSKLALTPAVDIFQQRKLGLISATDSASKINALKSIDTRDQYEKYFYQKGVLQQYSLNLSGGTNNLAWTIAGDYEKNIGNLNNKNEQVNFRFNNIYRPVKNLQLSVDAIYTNNTSVNGKNSFGTTLVNGRQVPYLQFADNNGNPLAIASSISRAYTDTVGIGKLLDWKYYPLTDYQHNVTTITMQEIYATVGLQYKFTNYLNLDLQYQYQKEQNTTQNLDDMQSFYTRNLINLFTQINSNGTITYIIPKGSINNITNETIQSHTARGQINVNKAWGHNLITGFVGGEARQATESSNTNVAYGYNADPLSYASVDFVNSYPTYINGGYQQIPSNLYFTNTINRFVSLFGNAAYTYEGKYTLSASARRDGANVFGATTNDKWKPLWSSGAAWDISKEKFFHPSWLPYLKLRSTYGYSGNVDLNRYSVPVAGSGTARYTQYPFQRITQPLNSTLRWEQVQQLNTGIEFSLKNNVLSGSIDYYIKKGTDLYGQTPYDYTTWGGNNVVTENIADLKDNGIDVILNSKNIDKTIKWSTTLLFNYNISKTTKYYTTAATQITTLLSGGNLIIPVIGEPLFGIAAYKWGGLDSLGNPQGYVNGKKTTDYNAIFGEGQTKGLAGNIVYKGSGSPIYFGSFINTFAWKQLSVSINISYKFDYYFRKPSIGYSSLVSSGFGNSEYAQRWQKPGDELITNVPSFVYPANSSRDLFYGQSEINVLRADNIRLQYINLSYSFNKIPIKGFPFHSMQVYANASNLGILWKANKAGYDPDYPNVIRPDKIWTFGVKANF